MRLKAEIEVSNRMLAVHNMSGRKGNNTHASLAIGRKPKGPTQTTLKENNQQVKLAFSTNCAELWLYSKITLPGGGQKEGPWAGI